MRWAAGKNRPLDAELLETALDLRERYDDVSAQPLSGLSGLGGM